MIRAKTPGQPGRRRTLRGLAVTLLGILLLGAAAHGLAWRWLTGAMTVAFSDWVTQQRARGWEVDHDLPQRGGWPLAARLAVPGLRIAGQTPALPQGFVWEAARLDLAIAPPRLDRLVIAAAGPQRIAVGGLSIPYDAARLEAVLPLDQGATPRPVELLLEGLRAETPQGSLDAGRVDARLLPPGGAADADPAIALRIEARAVGLPPLPDMAAFGRDVEHALVDAVLRGPPPTPAPLAPRDRAEAWRAGGGVLDVRTLALRWGPLAGELAMVLRLDAALQPLGEGRVALERPADAIAALAAAGMVAPRAAMTAQAVAGMMARPPEGGGAPRVELPIGIMDGTVTLARLPLLRLGRLQWPEGAPRLP